MKQTVSTEQIEKVAVCLKQLKDDPVKFVKVFFDVEPDEWQAEALNALAHGENVAIRSGHGVGKTCLLAWIVCWFLSTRPHAKIPCTAPTNHQLHDLLWAEISLWLSKSPILKYFISWTATRVGIVGSEEKWYAVARASNKPENLAGFHAQHLLYVVDEGSGVSDKIMEAVDGALSTEGALIVMAGNPTQLSGYFYNAFHKARKLFHTIHISSEKSKRVSKDYPLMMAEKWGRDSDIYRVRVNGDFPSKEATGFIGLDVVELAIQRWYDQTEDSGVCEIGVDVARFGDDETVFVVRRGGRVELLEPHSGWSTTQTSGRAIQLIKEYNATAIKIDDTGVGGGVTDNVTENVAEQNLNCNVVPCNFGGEGDEHYANYATVMWANLKDMLKAGELLLPNDDDLTAQLTTRRYSLTSKGKIIIERKEDMKKRDLPSPDRAEAVALAFAQPIQNEIMHVGIPVILSVKTH